ncbi:unnamed protein product [Sphagnum jensenii]|uniref:Uncharacterized protein n=1 Tax=Sphagnum jensenii TaxID=128206 RepID=A0ABP0VAR7_9BRYO
MELREQRSLPPSRSINMIENHKEDEWECQYIDKWWAEDRMMVYDIIKAANYLEIIPLMELGACKVGSITKGVAHEKLAELLLPEPWLSEHFAREEKKKELKDALDVFDADMETKRPSKLASVNDAKSTEDSAPSSSSSPLPPLPPLSSLLLLFGC